MTRKSLENVNCSWAQAAEAIGDKWTLLILRDAMFGVTTFSVFARNLGISRNILNQRLEHLQEHGIIEKRQLGLGSSRSEYLLTGKGKGLLTVLMALVQWGDEWVLGEGQEPWIVVDKEKRQPLKRLVSTDQSGNCVTIDDINFSAGPGANDEIMEISKKLAENQSIAS